MYRIFIVEDDDAISDAIRQRADAWGMSVTRAENYRDVMRDFAACDPHLVLMDISLPAFNGYHWCSEIRRLSKAPILFLSSASDNLNMVMAMNLGADDFIAKPFDMDVLMAKIRAMLRRAYDFAEAFTFIECGGARLNTLDGTLTVGDERVELSKNEFRILLTLFENRGRVVSREKLMDALWKTDSFVDENTLTVNVGRLRRKLDAAGLAGMISTRFGVGYLVE